MFRTLSAVAFAVTLIGLSSTSAQPDAAKLRFEVYKGKDTQFHWRLKDGTGTVLAIGGKGYKVAADVKEGTTLVRTAATDDRMKFEVFENAAKEYRWRLTDGNGEVVASSGVGYKAKADAEKAVASIKENAAKAELVEVKE
jgi:uncharacterized protein YegP (UPF0339 family)